METNNSPLKQESVLQISKKMSQNEVSITMSQPREHVIQSAINMLTNPQVIKHPRERKEAFLKSKGMSPEEISIAFERTSYGYPPQPPGIINPGSVLALQPMTPFQKFRDILHTVALFTGVSYGIYYLFKQIIIPFLFGKPKKPSAVEGAIINLEKEVKKTVGELKTQVDKVQADLGKVTSIQTEHQTAVRNLDTIKSEVAIVKGILLSRHQFPPVDSTSIPAWQMAACADSGDRSSPIVLPTSNTGSQNSDSSLEMIKEVEVQETENLDVKNDVM